MMILSVLVHSDMEKPSGLVEFEGIEGIEKTTIE